MLYFCFKLGLCQVRFTAALGEGLLQTLNGLGLLELRRVARVDLRLQTLQLLFQVLDFSALVKVFLHVSLGCLQLLCQLFELQFPFSYFRVRGLIVTDKMQYFVFQLLQLQLP
jgi:hypothetical protein